MQVWVDADACPKAIKEILCRAAIRTNTKTIFVANQLIPTPLSPYLQTLRVGSGFDVADNEIVKKLEKGDIVITADIPLAHAVVEKGGVALNPRGTLYTPNNIKQHLSIRNFNAECREAGMIKGGPGVLSKREIQAFANALDKTLALARRVNGIC